MTDTPEDLWSGLQPAPTKDEYSGRPVPNLPAHVVACVALDHQGLRRLLIRVPDGTENVPKPRTRGLRVTVEPLRTLDASTVGDHLNLACTEPATAAIFAVVVGEVIEELRQSPQQPREAVRRVLQRWSWFWSVPSQGLGAEEAIGLFGELWFLEQWVGPADADRLRSWTGPLRDRHDFKWPAASIEVKATRAPAQGAPRHRISNLDQLDAPEQGELYLFSLRVTPDPIGRHVLPDIIERIGQGFAGDLEATDLWNQRLAQARYSPAHADRYRQPMRIVAQELFRVTAGFPRISRANFPDGVPAGVDDITYSINLAACRPFRIATGPHDPAARDLRSTIHT